jgi:HemX protein
MLAGLTDRSWLWVAAGFYLAGLVLGTISLLRGERQSNKVINTIIVLGYIAQLLGLYARGRVVGGCPLGNYFEIFQFTAWSAISLYLVVGVTFRSSLLGYFTSCLGAVLTTLSLAIPAWDATRRMEIFGGNPWIELHAALALFSYGVFALLALTALMLVLRHYSLKTKRISGWFSFLPSMLDLDHISVRLLVTGVVMMTASLLGGAVYWLRDLSSVNLTKIIITLAIWLAYCIALALRLRGNLLARRFAWTCLALFGAVLVSLKPVDASRHPPELRQPPNVVPR